MRHQSIIACAALALVALAGLPQRPYADALVPLTQAREDIIATAETVVATHPLFNGASAGTLSAEGYLAYVRGIARGLREPLTRADLLEAEDLTLNRLHDPHTNVDLWSPAYSPDLLPVGFAWTADGLVAYRISSSPATIATGDRVLAIGGLPTADVLARLRRYLSGNGPWRRTLAAEALPLGNTLRWLGLVRRGGVSLLLRRPSGATARVEVPLRAEGLTADWDYLKGQLAFEARYVAPLSATVRTMARGFYSWRLTPDYGLFWLRACDPTPGYAAAVERFFAAVQTAGVHYVVIDLQGNGGGNSAVGNALLAHLPIRPRYRRYVARLGVRQDPTAIFHGQLYVLVDGGTMSSGVDVAEQLVEAAQGVLVGSPTGLASGAFGNVKDFRTPDGLMDYQVSTMFVGAVNGRLTPSLVPAIPLPLTAQDVAGGVNPVRRWLAGIAAPYVKT